MHDFIIQIETHLLALCVQLKCLTEKELHMHIVEKHITV